MIIKKEIKMGYYNKEKIQMGAKASDNSGEQKLGVKGGVGMGKKDAVGADKQFKGGSSEKVCYDHKKYC